MIDDAIKQEIALGIYEHNMLQFGEFTYKSGIQAPIYMNLRNMGSHPAFLKKVATVFKTMLEGLEYDLIAGIPYGAIPIMMAVSFAAETPVIFPRKESKEYGMGKDIIGEFQKGQRVVIVDDLVTKGDSKIESLVPFDQAGLVVKDFVVLLDYQKGATELLESKGYSLHAAMSVSEVVEIVHDAGKIDASQYEKVKTFLAQK